MNESHQPAIFAASQSRDDREGDATTHPDYAAIARRLTADLAALRAAVKARSGETNATLVHDHAAGALHRLLDAAGAYARRPV